MNAELLIYGTITSNKYNESDISALDVKNYLKGLEPFEPLNVRISSYGGCVKEALAIVQALRDHKGTVTTHVDSVAASSASFIALSGSHVIMKKHSLLMIHLPYVGLVGNRIAFATEIEALARVETSMIGIYESKLNSLKDKQTIIDDLEKETWYTADETAELFNIVIDDSEATGTDNSSSNKVATRIEDQNFLSRFQKNARPAVKKVNVLERFSKPATSSSGKTNIEHAKNETVKSMNRFAPDQYEKVEETKQNVLDRFKKVGR